MAQISSNLFSIQIVPTPALVTSFDLTSALGGPNLPFAVGFAFRKGDVPAGAKVAGSIPTLQVTGKNWWPDGSLKFATISGRADLVAGAPRTIKLGVGATADGPALSTADLRATGVTASIGAGAFGSAAWSGVDWDAPFQNWISGPQMSSWVYRKAVGGDPHLTAWLEVRLFAGGAVEILPWIENGYLNVAAPTSKNAEYSFSLGGTERFRAAFDLPNHCRSVLITGAHFSHWLGADPQIVPNHDKAYLQATRMVPAYGASVPASAGVWSTLAQSYTPLQRGNYASAMGNAGFQPAIGLLPEWDVLYLVSNNARAYAGVIANAYGAGRFGIHYRDETTQRPLRFSSYPNLVTSGSPSTGIANTGASSKNTFTPAAQGTAPPVWDSPHHPSIGFTAYLLTGRFYFMEEVQFSATVNYLKNTDVPRKFSSGVFLSNAGANTTRGAAWAIRTLAQAACVTPDSDTALRAEFAASMAANTDYYYATYISQPNNPFGFIAPYSNYTTGGGFFSEAAWMQDFFTAAIGYAIDLEPAMPQASVGKLATFFAWKAQSAIGRLGGTAPTDYLYRHAAQYTIAVAPSESSDFLGGTGPWHKNWGEIYAATLKAPNPGVDGALSGGNFPDSTSYWGNLQPAIAYAVQHKVPGAAAAYARMRGAPNWSEMTGRWSELPVWSVIPRNQ
ncbi:hypothetical protein [Massilia sp. TWR1-2-2]|uniref:hypothetical protein n=1 Tax=Massilia sp. TWR1-2-2 TaxID=2804584 RepID=UPI003CE896A9